jgi:hypothetical protein
MTKTQAIKDARDSVTELYLFGDGYKHNAYDHSLGMWRESLAQPLAAARASRSQSLIDDARRARGLEAVQYDGGKWTDYV